MGSRAAARKNLETADQEQLLLLCLPKPSVTYRTRKETHTTVDVSFYFFLVYGSFFFFSVLDLFFSLQIHFSFGFSFSVSDGRAANGLLATAVQLLVVGSVCDGCGGEEVGGCLDAGEVLVCCGFVRRDLVMVMRC